MVIQINNRKKLIVSKIRRCLINIKTRPELKITTLMNTSLVIACVYSQSRYFQDIEVPGFDADTWMQLKTCVVLLMVTLCLVRCANILAIFVAPSYGHQIPLLTLSIALAARGHNLTVITQNTSEIAIDDHTKIDIIFGYKLFDSGSLRIPFQSKLINGQWKVMIPDIS